MMFVLAAVINTAAFAQNRYQLVHPTASVPRTVFLDLGGGNTLYASRVSYPSGDSSHLELYWTNMDQLVADARSYRLHTAEAFLQDIIRSGDDFLLYGADEGLAPFLMRVNAAGDVLWFGAFDPLLSGGFSSVLDTPTPDGAFRAYDRGDTSGFHSITGDTSGTVFSGVRMDAADLSLITLTGAARLVTGDLVFGKASTNTGSDNHRMMLARTDSSGASWMKLFDMDPDSWMNEYARDMEVLSDGTVLLVGHASDGLAGGSGYIMKLDTLGSMQWCRKYSDAGGTLGLTGAIELNGGDLLIAGSADFAMLILLRLDPNGNIIWQRKLPIGFHEPEDFHRNDIGGFVLMEHDTRIELDAAGNGCGFVTSTSVSSAPHVPDISTETVTNTAVVPVFTTHTVQMRLPILTWMNDCLSVGVEEAASAALIAYPVPTSGKVVIGPQDGVRPDAQVIVCEATGAEAFRGSYGMGLDLESMPAGVYLCSIPELGLHVRLVRQ
ncbi:MAG: hypothetical protein ABI599_01485 [Flavobacteriales bacterium]